jgi:two-component system, OmpR family, sensor kinase
VALRTRLLLALGAVALVALIVADAVTYTELRSFLYDGVDQSLQASHVPVERSVSGQADNAPGPNGAPGSTVGQGPPPGIGGGPQLRATCPAFDDSFVDTSGLMPGTFIEVRSADNTTVWSCRIAALGTGTNLEPTLPAKIVVAGSTTTGTESGPEGAGAGSSERAVYFTAASKHAGTEFRVRASVLSSGAYQGGQLVLAVPLDPTAGTLDRLFRIELAVTAGALLTALALGWWLVRVGMQPLRAMERTADAIAQGELDQRVPGEQARTEVGHLARALNVMLSRIESAFSQRDKTELELRESEARMRQFVADASHELRTPITSIRGYAELYRMGGIETEAQLGDAMRRIEEDATRTGHMVEDLLMLARLDQGRPLEKNRVDFVQVSADAIVNASLIQPDREIELDAPASVEVMGDEDRLRQVVANLLENALVYTPESAGITVRLHAEGSGVILEVADEGAGIPPEHLDRIFERFYRVDPSRSRSTGGTGLGLSIVASIVEAHGGKVSVSSEEGRGTVFRVQLPTEVQGPSSPAGRPVANALDAV